MTHDKWWYEVGSGIRPLPNEDFEEFSERVTRIAWDASVAAEREACARLCEQKSAVKGGEIFAARIRARGSNGAE